MSGAARRRLVNGLGLGPLWVRRTLQRRDAAPTTPGGDADASPASESTRAALIAGMDWLALRDTIAGCQACRLSETRTRAVPGSGSETARWLVVGGGPSADDDASGEAFDGRAGRLLDAMLASVGRSRAVDVHATHVVKCRPPGDRAALDDEIAACRPFLARQVALLEPGLALAAGERAAATLGDDVGARGEVRRVQIGERELAAIVTDDPADLLRAPERKAGAWADLCLARTTAEAGADRTRH